MFPTVLQVALGGAIGASLRYLVGVATIRTLGPGFPVATMIVNVVGSFVMGAFVVYAARQDATHLSPFLMTGLLGGFTTFSAFSLDAVSLFERGEVAQAASYVAVSVVVSILALVAGLASARALF